MLSKMEKDALKVHVVIIIIIILVIPPKNGYK